MITYANVDHLRVLFDIVLGYAGNLRVRTTNVINALKKVEELNKELKFTTKNVERLQLVYTIGNKTFFKQYTAVRHALALLRYAYTSKEVIKPIYYTCKSMSTREKRFTTL